MNMKNLKFPVSRQKFSEVDNKCSSPANQTILSEFNLVYPLGKHFLCILLTQFKIVKKSVRPSLDLLIKIW